VVTVAFNRPDYLQRHVNSLLSVHGSDPANRCLFSRTVSCSACEQNANFAIKGNTASHGCCRCHFAWQLRCRVSCNLQRPLIHQWLQSGQGHHVCMKPHTAQAYAEYRMRSDLLLRADCLCREKFPLFISQDGTPVHEPTQRQAQSYEEVSFKGSYPNKSELHICFTAETIGRP